MKKVKFLALGLALATLMTGCTFGGRNVNIPIIDDSHSEYEVQEEKKDPKPIDTPEVNAYKEFLLSRVGEDVHIYKAALMRIDDDEVYELALFSGEDLAPNIYLYGYIDGKVTNLEIDGFPFYGTPGNFFYFDRKNCFYYEYVNAQGDAAVVTEFIFSLVNGLPKLNHELVTETAYESEAVTYFLDGEEITEQQYKDFCDEFKVSERYNGTAVPLLSNYCTEITNEEGINKALSFDYGRKYYDRMSTPVKKPAIYLYPEEDDTTVTVELDIDGYYTQLIPEFNEEKGWKVEADRNGDISLDGQTYDYLFWEAMLDTSFTFDEGFCVKGKDTREFLEKVLTESGLNEKEKEQFIEYWLPYMEGNEYNVISFQTSTYIDHADLKVTPAPDTVIRVFMAFYPSDEYVDINAQEIVTPTRCGFTVVEWGGSEVTR